MLALNALLCASLVLAASETPAPRWPSPLGGQSGILRAFDLTNGEYQAGHRGIVLRAQQGTTVAAPVAGVVSFEGAVAGREVITLRVDERTLLSFEPVHAVVTEGESVTAGAQIGIVDGGTHCGVSCLHIGVRVDGKYVNPLRYFEVRRPRLLPLNG